MIISFFIIRLSKQIYKKYQLIKSNKGKTKVAMCAVVKQENKYLKYYIDFYKKLGYDHIYFYDNNEPGDESIDDLQIVKDGINNGFITKIKYKNDNQFYQIVYYDCYEKYNKEYDWISFFDIDEYLMLVPKNTTIQQFLDNPRYKNCDTIKINWRLFTDNDQLDWEDKPLIERFPIESDFTNENKHVKSIIRGKIYYKNFRRNNNAHSIYNNIKACSASGKKTNWAYYLWPPDLKYASLNHYVTKSIREFYYKKKKKKMDADSTDDKKKYLFKYFFSVNKKSKVKVLIFNQIYHTNYK